MCMGRLPTLHPSTAAVFVVNGRAPSSVNMYVCACDKKQVRPSSVQTTISELEDFREKVELLIGVLLCVWEGYKHSIVAPVVKVV